MDLHLIGEGRHEQMWCNLGAHIRHHQGVTGTSFVVWAPNARGVRVVGDFNSWDGRLNPMRRLGTSGLWELFLPDVGKGQKYKYEIIDANGQLRLKADPFAFAAELPPGTASVVFQSEYTWNDDAWIRAREESDPLHSPFTVYECHLGSWRTVPEEDDRPLTYRELAEQLPAYLNERGFTHVEFLPVAEHPYAPSWGYQVSAYYAPTARFGTPDDFRYLVDKLHEAGIGVIVDWVPAHFPKDDFALATLRRHGALRARRPPPGRAPRLGHAGLQLRPQRGPQLPARQRPVLGGRVPHRRAAGRRRGLDAVPRLLPQGRRVDPQQVRRPREPRGHRVPEGVQHHRARQVPRRGDDRRGVDGLAEVSRPTYVGGLGFTLKWNMGWMHDTLDYFSPRADPPHATTTTS